MIKHQAHDSEENLYRQCLADKLPNIQQADYVTCTNNIYSQRVELLMTHYANSAEKILADIHWKAGYQNHYTKDRQSNYHNWTKKGALEWDWDGSTQK